MRALEVRNEKDRTISNSVFTGQQRREDLKWQRDLLPRVMQLLLEFSEKAVIFSHRHSWHRHPREAELQHHPNGPNRRAWLEGLMGPTAFDRSCSGIRCNCRHSQSAFHTGPSRRRQVPYTFGHSTHCTPRYRSDVQTRRRFHTRDCLDRNSSGHFCTLHTCCTLPHKKNYPLKSSCSCRYPGEHVEIQ